MFKCFRPSSVHAYLLLTLVTVTCIGCAQSAPGPAERIGRGVDDILGGVKELQAETSPTPIAAAAVGQGAYRDENLNKYRSLREQWDAEEAARIKAQKVP
jgi:hypothetical protein